MDPNTPPADGVKPATPPAGNGNGGEVKPDAGSTSAEPEKKTETPENVPYARFQEVNRQKKELEEKLAAQEKAGEEAKQKELVEQNRFKELYEAEKAKVATLDSTKSELEAYAKVAGELAESSIAELKDIVGEDKLAEAKEILGLDDLSPIDKLKKLPRLKQFLSDTIGKAKGAGASGGQAVPTGGSPDKFVELKKKMDEGRATPAERAEFLRENAKVNAKK